jgi:hypothetical protein
MRKIVINTSYGTNRDGGFCLSHKAFLRLRELGQQQALQEPNLGAYWPQAAGPREPSLNRCGVLIPRDDEKLVQVVGELGAEANGHCAELKIVEVPKGVQWEIERMAGVEHVSEAHRTWR